MAQNEKQVETNGNNNENSSTENQLGGSKLTRTKQNGEGVKRDDKQIDDDTVPHIRRGAP